MTKKDLLLINEEIERCTKKKNAQDRAQNDGYGKYLYFRDRIDALTWVTEHCEKDAVLHPYFHSLE